MGNSKLFNKQGKDFKVTSPYGMRDPFPGVSADQKGKNYHIGTDYAYPQGTELVSPVDGEVISVSNWGDYGGQVFIYSKELDHTIHFAHVSKAMVKDGQKVKVGQVIGLSGGAKGTNGAGTSTGAHLHIGLAQGKNTSLNKGTMGDGLWVDIDKFKFTKPKPKGEVLHLPKTAKEWRVYPMDKDPVVGNEVGKLFPAKFGGLEYDVLGYRKGDPNVVFIQTRDFGKVQIYVAKDTGAKITGAKSNTIKVGSKVKITGDTYTTGQKVPLWVKRNTYTVQSISGDKALIKEIQSMVYLKDLVLG